MGLFNPSKADQIAPALTFLNVRFVLLLTGIVPNSGIGATLWNFTTVHDSLRNATNMRLVLQNNYVSLWENTENSNNDLYLSTNPVIERPLPVILSGSWESKNGSIQGIQGKLLLTNQTLNDFVLTARISLVSNQSYDASLIFGYSNYSNYYYAGLFGKSYLITLGQYSQGIRHDGDSQPGFASPLYVHVSVRADNLLVNYSYDGATWPLARNSSIPNYHGGFVGLLSSQNAEFDDVHLWNQMGDQLFNATSALSYFDLVSNQTFLDRSSVLLPSSSTEQLSRVDGFPPIKLTDTTINRLDSTSYRIQVRNATNYIIVLNEGYDANWSLYDGNVSWYQALFIQPSRNCSHIPANTFGNAWVCNSTGKHDFTLYYLPQSHFVFGSMVSIFFGAFSILFVFIRSKYLTTWMANKRQLNAKFVEGELVEEPDRANSSDS